MTEFGRVITQNEHNLHNGNFKFTKPFERRKNLFPKGFFDYTDMRGLQDKAKLKNRKTPLLCKKSGVTHKSALDERGNEALDRGAELRMMNDEMNFGSVAL